MKLYFKIIVALFAGLFSQTFSFGQQVQVVASGVASSFRGLSVVDDRTVWVSGSNGMVGRSLDGGVNWKWVTVKGFEKREFRDIEAFDETSAVILSVDEPAYILRTSDGGETWKVTYENKTKGMFLDAMEFWNLNSGVVLGDPINGHFFIARTFDGGINWRSLPENNYPKSDSGEACFASSGTNIRKISKQEAVFVSGGLKSRLFIRDQSIPIPIIQGTESTGANSIAVKGEKHYIIVGGDFNLRNADSANCCITTDGGKTFQFPNVRPHGYRSCVEYLRKKDWITCGLNGVDISNDDGFTWRLISSTGFHVCRKAKEGKSVFFAGNGRVAKLVD